MEELMLGADGIVGGLVDAFPEETVAIYKLVKAGMYKEALEIYSWFLPLLELDIHPKLVQYIKLAATQTGICYGKCKSAKIDYWKEKKEKMYWPSINKAIATRPVYQII